MRCTRCLAAGGDVRVVEAKRGFGLVDRDLPRDLGDVAIECSADVVVIAEDERLL